MEISKVLRTKRVQGQDFKLSRCPLYGKEEGEMRMLASEDHHAQITLFFMQKSVCNTQTQSQR